MMHWFCDQPAALLELIHWNLPEGIRTSPRLAYYNFNTRKIYISFLDNFMIHPASEIRWTSAKVDKQEVDLVNPIPDDSIPANLYITQIHTYIKYGELP
jgi:hypothetical protein